MRRKAPEGDLYPKLITLDALCKMNFSEAGIREEMPRQVGST